MVNVLVLGGTGNVGKLVIEQLIERGEHVKAIVRSPEKLPHQLTTHPNFSVVKAGLTTMTHAEMREHLCGCDAVISCLGHTLSLRGVFGPPRQLVLNALKLVCQSIQEMRPAAPIKIVHLNTIGVDNPEGTDVSRSLFERNFLWALVLLTPPLTDSYNCAQYLSKTVGKSDPYVQWCAVRPDSFVDGKISPYTTQAIREFGIFTSAHSTKANIAHFMCDLACLPATWNEWKGKMPILTDVATAETQLK